MNLDHLSASSIKTYNMCNFAYYLRYICGLKGFENEGSIKGTIFHGVMEDMAEMIVNNKQYLEKHMEESFEKYWIENTKNEIYIEISSKDKDKLYDCLYKRLFKERVLDCKILGIEQEFDFTFDYKYNVLSENLGKMAKEIGVDTKTCIDSLGECFRIFGFIDLVYEKDENSIIIRDYKTSKKSKNEKECRNDIQFLMYDLAVKLLYPEYKNRIIEVLFENGNDISYQYKDDEYKNTIKYLKNKWIEIKENNSPVQTISKNDSFWKCDYCVFRGEKNDNGKYKGGKWQCNRLIKIMGSGESILENVFERIRNGEKI